MRQLLACVVLCLSACASDGRALDDGSSIIGTDDGPPSVNNDGGLTCNDSDPDQSGCACATPGATRACYPSSANPAMRNIGICKDGTQTCNGMGEFSSWGACMNAITPGDEICTDKVDNNCDGHTDCEDAACATSPSCKTGCTNGATRTCYDGKTGTLGVGQCHAGVQTCANQMWPSNCPGEVTPGSELGKCSDNIDNDCNGKVDCKDFVCLLDAHCQQPMCTAGQTQSCYDGPMGTAGVGVCKAGTQSCMGGEFPPCSGEVQPGIESGNCSDGLDNDCNGLVDCKDPSCGDSTACCPSGGATDGSIFANSPDTLYRVIPGSWDIVKIGGFNFADSMTDIALTPTNVLYGISFTTLYLVDKTSAQASKVMDVPGSTNNSMTFLKDGTLLVADANGAVHHIDPVAKTVNLVGNFGNSLTAEGDLVAIGSGTMFGISGTTPGGGDASSSNELVTVNVSTGVAAGVGQIGFGNVWGLAYSNGQVIGFSDQGEIFQIDPASAKGTLLKTWPVQFWGATSSPLVPASGCVH